MTSSGLIIQNKRYCIHHEKNNQHPFKCRALRVYGSTIIDGDIHCANLEARLEKMEERIHELEMALLYAPGGIAYQEGEKRWNEFVANEKK